MKNKSILFLACIIPLLDILWEILYQFGVVLRLGSLIKEYKNLYALISPSILKNINHSLSHGLNHLMIDQLLYTVCLFFLFLTLNARVRISMFNLLKHFLKFTLSFMGVSKTEMFLLQLQCAILRSLESKWIYDAFVEPNTVLNRLWIPVVVLVVAPIEARFKVYMEKKFHSLSTVLTGLAHATATVLFPIFYLYYLSFFNRFEPLNIDFDVLESANTKLFTTSTNLNDSGFIQYSDFMHNYIVFDSSAMAVASHDHHASLTSHSNISPDISHDYYSVGYVCYFNLHKSANHRYYLLAPFMKNLIFAGCVSIADKLLLKSLCSTEINHVCAHLIMEEFLSTILFRYLLLPFNIYEKYQVYKYDDTISKIPDKEKIITAGLNNNISFHGFLHPSVFFRIFNNQTSLLSRLDNILRS